MSHTKEPWRVDHILNAGIRIAGAEGDCVCLVYEDGGIHDAHDANRIVACVNACAGIPTSSLDGEVGVVESVTKFTSEELAEARQQRDELLAVCEELAECAAYWSEYDVPLGIADRLNAAIAKAKEGAR